jgi:hypothetical protein
MGIDVFGNSPTQESGQHFRRTWWRWRPMAELVCTLEPELTCGCASWQSNDGDGLDAATSIELGKALKASIASGRVRRLIKARDKALAGLPDEACDVCTGTGIRADHRGTEDGQPTRIIGPDTDAKPDHPRYGQTGWCNGCNGRGHNPPSATHYHVTIADVREFANFLAACGGFEIC